MYTVLLIMLHCIVLYLDCNCIVFYCIMLYGILLYCIVLYCNCVVLYLIVLYCNYIVFYCIVLYRMVLKLRSKAESHSD